MRQGVTLEVFGESSMGPLTEQMKKDQMERQGDIKFNIVWNTLGGYLDHLVARGISTNVASFVSAATVRANEVGLDNRAPTPEELERMRAHVRVAMDEGAMGLTTALIYIPGVFAKTDELVELAKVASASGGMYISHMRSEGEPAARGDRRDADDRARGEDPRRDLSPEGERRVELEQAGRGDREDRGRAQGRARDHRRHVHLHRRLHRPRRRDAAVGAGGRLQGVGEAPAGSEDSRARPPRDDDAADRRGRT